MWGEKTVVIITGASRGIGREIAIRFAEKVGEGSLIILVARTATALEATREAVITTASKTISVLSWIEDLGRTEGVNFYAKLAGLLEKEQNFTISRGFDRAILVHNAGTLGIVDKKGVETGDDEGLDAWKAYYDLHVFSVIALNTAFFRHFRDVSIKKTVINITSLAAIVPIPGWAMYCSARAAREALFRSMAAEEPATTVLSYSPGPVETDMLAQVRQESLPETKKMMQGAVVLTATETTSRLIEILDKGHFKSGGRVDYFDVCG